MVDKSCLQLDGINIYDFFSVATERDSATVVGKKLFDFVGRQSKSLVVTIGDSWTWGADLTQQKTRGTHIDRLVDDDYRIRHMYGNVLAKKINADFLSLGESGAGNWHINKKIEELYAIGPDLAYDRILVISIFTDLGRDFDSHHDIEVDYRSWLLENIRSAVDYYNFLKFVNHQISQRISDTIKKFDKRYQFIFSTNFVDPIGYDLLADRFLPKTWLEIICAENKIDYTPNKCYMVFPWVIEKFKAVLQMAPELDKSEWLIWINELVRDANMRAAVCFQDNINFGPLLHPSAHNHRVWSEYLGEYLNGKI